MNHIDRFIKFNVRYLRGRDFLYPRGQTFEFLSRNYERTIIAIRGFYLMSFVVAISNIISWWPQLQASTFQFPLWPFFGLEDLFLKKMVSVISIMWVLGSALAFYKPENFLFRLIQALGIFYFIALINSDGLFSHSRHGLMWVSLIFLFLSFRAFKEPSRTHQFKLIQGFWAAQFLICTFYLMTGIWKIVSIGECLVYKDVVCELGPKILTNIAAQEMFEYQNFAPWGRLFFDYPWLGFFSYLGTMWIHVASMHYAFRVDQHLSFGALRVVFHLGTFVFFGVIFNGMTACVAILFLASPFTHSRLLNTKEVFFRTPLVGDFFAYLLKIKNQPVFRRASESITRDLILRMVYAIICYQFCRDTSWGWRRLYDDLDKFESFHFMFTSWGPGWFWIIDAVIVLSIASSLLAALFSRKLIFRAMVAISTIAFLSFYHFHLRGFVQSLGYIGVVCLLLFTPQALSIGFRAWRASFIGLIVAVILGLDYYVWGVWLYSADPSFSNSYMLNLIILKYPRLFFVLFQSFVSGALFFIIRDFLVHRYQRVVLLTSLTFLAFNFTWKIVGTEFLLPLLLIVYYFRSFSPSEQKVVD